jgi:type IV secretion system protein VirB3
MYLVCLRDPRAFRLAYLWLETNGRSIGTRHWGSATFTPLPNTRNKR